MQRSQVVKVTNPSCPPHEWTTSNSQYSSTQRVIPSRGCHRVVHAMTQYRFHGHKMGSILV